LYQYTISPSIAKVTSTKNPIPYFSLGLLGSYSDSYSSKIDIFFDVKKDIPEPRLDDSKFNYYYKVENDGIYYERTVGLGMKLKLLAEKLSGSTKLTINDTYYKLVRVRIDNLNPPGIHLSDILSIKLLRNGYMPIHAAAISREGKGHLLVAPPDTGKSLTTFSLLKEGFHYLAEDIAIIDNENIYANPATSTFLHNDEYRAGTYNPFFSIIKKIPFLSYYIGPNIEVTSITKDFQIDEKVSLNSIFILDRGHERIERIDSGEALRRILIINRNEFSYFKNPLLFAYSYFNPSMNIDALVRQEEKILEETVKRADCFLLCTHDPKNYSKLVNKTLSYP
jgi:hypothetical protein